MPLPFLLQSLFYAMYPISQLKYFDSKKIYSFIWNFKLSLCILIYVCVRSLVRASRSAICRHRNSYSNLRFTSTGIWSIVGEKTEYPCTSLGEGPVHRVSVIGGCALRRMRCASGAYLRITLRTASPDGVLCTGLSTVNRLTVVLKS